MLERPKEFYYQECVGDNRPLKEWWGHSHSVIKTIPIPDALADHLFYFEDGEWKIYSNYYNVGLAWNMNNPYTKIGHLQASYFENNKTNPDFPVS